MRILMLGWELPPHNSGGLGVACYELARALANNGARIDFVLPHSRLSDEPDREFMTVHHVPSQGVALLDAYTGDFDTVRQLQSDYTRYVSRSILPGHQPDVIHAHDWLTFEAGVRAKRQTGAPLIAHVHATEFDRAGGQRGNPLIHDIEQHGLLMADRIIAVSHATKKLIVRNYHIPSDKIEVIHNSVDAGGIISQSLPDRTLYAYAKSLQGEGYKVVVTLGRLTVQKGLVHFLLGAQKALSRYHKLLFIVAGSGEQRDELVQLSADLGISRQVLFTGFLRGAEWRELYDVADIFVMNSVSEPFGLTALEAAVQDTAILLSRQSGVGEVLLNVLKHDYWDTDRLADEIIAVASSPGLRQELAAGAKRDFASISWQRAAELCTTQYRAVGALA